MKEILKHTILALTLLNLPMFGLVAVDSTLGALASALSLAALFLYYFFVKKSKPLLPLLLLGILYYSIGGFSFSGDLSLFVKNIFRYFLFIISITEVAKNTTSKEALFYLIIGALSVIINALMYSDDYGRYSGLYLNPNNAGLICILGFSLTYTITNRKYKLLAQLLFTIGGLATLSRYFIIMLVVINIASIFANRKNAIGLLAGVVGFVIILNTPAFELNTSRFEALESLFSSGEIKTKTITRETRQETWALYTDKIIDNLIVGKGYGSMQGNQADSVVTKVGVHNTFLMILGEAGIIPFLLIVILHFSLIFKSLKLFKKHTEYFYISIVIFSYLLTSHNYFYNYIILFITVWVYTKLFNNVDEDINIEDIDKTKLNYT